MPTQTGSTTTTRTPTSSSSCELSSAESSTSFPAWTSGTWYLSCLTTCHTLVILGSMLGILWTIAIVNWISGGELNQYGIEPRQFDSTGFVSILWAPLIHGSLGHIAGNTIPFYGLGALVLLKESPWIFAALTAFLWFDVGLLVWCFGRGGTVHYGISGVIYGYFAFIMTCAYVSKDWSTLLVAAIALVTYGSIMIGGVRNVTPFADENISWEGHLFGAISGIAVGFALHEVRARGLLKTLEKRDEDSNGSADASPTERSRLIDEPASRPSS